MLPNCRTDWRQSWYKSVDSSGNGHRLNTITSKIPSGAIGGGGGVRGSTIQNTGKCGQTAGPVGNKLCKYNADESGNGHRLTNWPHEPPGGGFRVSIFHQNSGE